LDKLSRQVPPWVAGILVCLLLTAFRGPDASAQTSAPSTNSPPNGALISFELIRGHIVVTARANDSRPVSLMLDTGYTINMLSAEVIESLQLKRTGKITIVGIAGEREADVYEGPKFDFAELSYSPRRVSAFESEARPRRRREDGILGSGFFRRFVVEIDHQAKTVRLHEPKSYQYAGQGEVIPLKFRKETPIVEALINIPGRPAIRDRFEIDLGCDGGLCLGHDFVDQHKLIESANETQASSRQGVGGSAKTTFGHLPQLQLGAVTINNPAVNFFVESSPVDRDLAGHIGIQVLREFRVIFDYSRQRMILEKYASAKATDVRSQAR